MGTGIKALLHQHSAEEVCTPATDRTTQPSANGLQRAKIVVEAHATPVLHRISEWGQGLPDSGEGGARRLLGRGVHSRVCCCHRWRSNIATLPVDIDHATRGQSRNVDMLNCYVCYFSDIPPDIDSFVVSIYNKEKMSKDKEVCECNWFSKSCTWEWGGFVVV